MLDAAVLAQALRAGIRLRDQVVVLEVDPVAATDPARMETLAADLALARALGIQVITVCPVGAGSGPLDAHGPALRLGAALDRHGARSVLLPAAGMVTVHILPPEAVAAAPGVPAMIPVINTVVLIHLSALGYIPILVPPVVDAAGQAVALGAGALAVFLAQFLSAALLVLPVGSEAPVGAQPGLPALPPVLTTGPASPGSLIAGILLHAPEVPAGALAPHTLQVDGSTAG